MSGMEKRILLLAGLMTCQAALGVFFGIGSEGKNQFIRRKGLRFVASSSFLPLNVRFSWTVTGLAVHHGLFARCQPCVGRLAVLNHFSSVTPSAAVIAHESVRRSGCRRRGPCYRWP